MAELGPAAELPAAALSDAQATPLPPGGFAALPGVASRRYELRLWTRRAETQEREDRHTELKARRAPPGGFAALPGVASRRYEHQPETRRAETQELEDEVEARRALPTGGSGRAGTSSRTGAPVELHVAEEGAPKGDAHQTAAADVDAEASPATARGLAPRPPACPGAAPGVDRPRTQEIDADTDPRAAATSNSIVGGNKRYINNVNRNRTQPTYVSNPVSSPRSCCQARTWPFLTNPVPRVWLTQLLTNQRVLSCASSLFGFSCTLPTRVPLRVCLAQSPSRTFSQ